MASTATVLFAALGAALFYTCLGAALTQWLKPRWAVGLAFAPALGWGVFTALALPLQEVVGFGRGSTALLAAAALAGAIAVLVKRPPDRAARTDLPSWALGLAAAIALIPLAGILPKLADGGVILGAPAFDHSKVAMIDEMTRLGLPAGNPFFGEAGSHATLSYYYLWHFSAAELSGLAGVSGWEADAAMTGVTAFASLLLMMGLALNVSARLSAVAPLEPGKPAFGAGRASTLLWVALLSLTGTLRPLLGLILGEPGLKRLLTDDYHGVAGWISQASWVPQHLASTSCVLLAVLVFLDLALSPSLRGVLVLGALAAAGFESSAWVGGVTFVIAGAGVGLLALIRGPSEARRGFVLGAAAAVALALVLALPLLMAEFSTLKTRQAGAPIAVHPYEVLGSIAPEGLRRALDLPAFWLLLLPIDLAAIYPAGVALMVMYFRRAGRARDAADLELQGLAVLAGIGLIVGWLLISTLGNNDLGWRAVLPAVLVLTAFAAAGLSRWITARAYAPAAGALVLAAASLPDPQIRNDLQGKHSPDAQDFAAAPELWAAVRRHAGPTDRVADNPLYLDDLTDWPVNPSWALLSNRPSCFSGWETARAYVDLPSDRVTALQAQFTSVFAGHGTREDIRQMAQVYDCRVVVVTDSDGAWTADPFAASPYYRLAESQPEAWRIYVATAPRASSPASIDRSRQDHRP